MQRCPQLYGVATHSHPSYTIWVADRMSLLANPQAGDSPARLSHHMIQCKFMPLQALKETCMEDAGIPAKIITTLQLLGQHCLAFHLLSVCVCNTDLHKPCTPTPSCNGPGLQATCSAGYARTSPMLYLQQTRLEFTLHNPAGTNLSEKVHALETYNLPTNGKP